MVGAPRLSYAQLLETNNLLQTFTDETYWLCVTRTVQESKLFPVPPYMLLSYLNAFYRYPSLLRKVESVMTAEEIGDRADLQEGRLVTAAHWKEDWSVWERHPAGDEIVFVLWGRADLILEEDGGERIVPLPSGHACIVPRGVWHTARVPEPTNALAITRGAGAEHRPAAG